MHRLFLVTFTCTVLALATVIASVGLWVDPFAFFTPVDRGFRRESAYTLNRSLFRTVEFRKLAEEMAAANRQINVIVGDSIGNQIDSAPVEQITGEAWFNYSYGQATLAENISLLEDLIDGGYPIKRIVWSLAFSRVRDGGKNEMARSLEFVDSPAWHLFTFESLRGVYYVLRQNWFGIKLVDRRFDMEQAELVAYMNQRLQMDLKAMSWPAETLAAVAQLEQRATAKGIEFSYAILPVHPQVQQLFVDGFQDRYRQYIDFVSQQCVVDLREQPGFWTGDMFRDAFHLTEPYRPKLSRMFAETLLRACIERPARVAGPVRAEGT